MEERQEHKLKLHGTKHVQVGLNDQIKTCYQTVEAKTETLTYQGAPSDKQAQRLARQITTLAWPVQATRYF